MPRKVNPESNADTASRTALRNFLTKARKFLNATHRSVTSHVSRLDENVKNAITVLWKDADDKLHGVIQSQEIGNPQWRRDYLSEAGVFGDPLSAKERLFDFFREEKRILAALRLLASIFGSLSKAFPILSAAKEFIDAVLCARDWLPTDPEITTLGDLR